MIKHRLALVTGATSGIGTVLCRLLAQEGISLIMTGTNEDRLNELEADLGKNVKVYSVIADLKNREDRQKLIRLMKDLVPDLVINNAGFGMYGEVLTHTTQEQMDILEVNGNAAIELTIEAARALIAKGEQGVIMNISSVAGFQYIPSSALYSCSKALVTHFSQTFDMEVSPHGVRVLTACPGMVATEFPQRAGGNASSHQRSGVLKKEDVAAQILSQIKQGKDLSIIDWRYALATYFSKLLPKKWTARYLQKAIEGRISKRKYLS